MVGSKVNSGSVDSTTDFQEGSPAAKWSAESAKHALDDLFKATFAYRTSNEFYDLLKFIKTFRFYSPFNAMLIHLQRPGARFVAPANKWEDKYGYSVKTNANPILILQPMGPVMFVFDVADAEPGPEAKPLPTRIDKPFDVKFGKIGSELKMTIENAKRDGVLVLDHKSGSQLGGSIRQATGRIKTQRFQIGSPKKGEEPFVEIPIQYKVLCSIDLSEEARYATIVHELAHLYCGHLGTPNRKWWPDRRGISRQPAEFEAESVSYLVCTRLNLKTSAEKYLAGYVSENNKVPKISLECIMKAAWIIERMGKKRLKKRKGEPSLDAEKENSSLIFPPYVPKDDMDTETEGKTSGSGSSDSQEFDEATWLRLKPELEKIWRGALTGGISVKDLIKEVVAELNPKGLPYFEKFIQEKTGGEQSVFDVPSGRD